MYDRLNIIDSLKNLHRNNDNSKTKYVLIKTFNFLKSIVFKTCHCYSTQNFEEEHIHADKTNAALTAERDELYDIYKISPPVEI